MDHGSPHLQFLAAFSATLVYLIAGTFLGWVSPTVPRLYSMVTHEPLSEDQASWVVSLVHIGHVLPAIPAGYIVNWVGRKWTLAFTAAPFFASWVLAVVAEETINDMGQHGETRWYVKVELLYASRLLAGIGVGIGSTVAAMYLSEIAEDRIRGTISTLFQLMANLGVMFEYSIAPYVEYSTLNSMSAFFPLLFFLTFIWMPESPYYLVMKHRRKEAEDCLLSLRSLTDPRCVQKELEMIESSMESGAKYGGTFRDLLTKKCNQRALLICVGLFTITACSGHIAILSYSTEIFKRSRSSLDASVSVMVIGGIQIVLSIFSSMLVDIAGRRPLLLASCLGCAVSLMAEGLYFYMMINNDVSHIDWLPLSAIVLFLISYTLGLGSVPIAIMGETFPTNVKGLASSLLSIYIALMNFLVTKLVKIIQVQYYVVFWSFSSFCIMGVVFVIFVVPETKGKSMLQINRELDMEMFVGKEKKSLLSDQDKSSK